MAHTAEMVNFALKLKPDFCCIVPEKREEKTTEGGLNLKQLSDEQLSIFKNNIKKISESGIKISLFIDPNKESVLLAKELGADIVELHTGEYANKFNTIDEFETLEDLSSAAELANKNNLIVNAGHGLNIENLSQICAIKHINEINIGHAIISEAVFTGLKDAIQKFISIINNNG